MPISVWDAITCECNNCVDEEIKTVSARHAEAFRAACRGNVRPTVLGWHLCRRCQRQHARSGATSLPRSLTAQGNPRAVQSQCAEHRVRRTQDGHGAQFAAGLSEAAGSRVGRMTMDGKVTEFPIPSHDSQPRAMVSHPDGSIWFVETSTNALGRIDRNGKITEHKVPTPNASLRGVTVGADGDLWYTANFANKIGRMAPDGTVLGEYDIPTPGSGARCIAPMSDGRLFLTQWDAGLIGEVIVK